MSSQSTAPTSFAQWETILRDMSPLEVGERWSAAYEGREPGFDRLYLHMAVVDRLYQIALLAPALSQEQRAAAAAVSFAQRVITTAAERFSPDAMAQMRNAVAEAVKDYEAYATDTAREYLFETRQINQWGGFLLRQAPGQAVRSENTKR